MPSRPGALLPWGIGVQWIFLGLAIPNGRPFRFPPYQRVAAEAIRNSTG